jgi:uncharacterized membrane protein
MDQSLLNNEQSPARPAGRIDAIDVARGLALVAMAIYHFTWDLEFFGYVPAGMTAVGGWKLFARCIASSFLFLVGVSLFLGHGGGIRWQGFGRRMAMVAGAALAISIVTYVAVPDAFIFFGILHEIALASLLGLAFLRLPAAATLAVAAAVIAAPHFLRSPFFDDPWWWWTGLSQTRPRSNDYVPVFPWFGAVLLGIAAARFASRAGLLRWLAGQPLPRWSKPLVFAGRHSLAFYLIHQPVLIAGVWLFSLAVPPVEQPREALFLQSCEATCTEQRDTAFCASYCGCVLEMLERDGAMEDFYAGRRSEALSRKAEDVARLCTIETDSRGIEGEEDGSEEGS